MENIKLEYKSTFESPIIFFHLGENHPDNYYMNKCILILNHLSEKELYKLECIERGGGGGQGCGYVWNAYKYMEDSIEKEILLTVTHDANEVYIEINYDESNLSKKFIETIKEKIKDLFFNNQTVYTNIIHTEIKDIKDKYYENYVIKILNYFDKHNYHFCNTKTEKNLFNTIYTNHYQINNYDIKIIIIVSDSVIYIYIDGFNNNLDKIGFQIEDFENYLKK